MFNAIKDKIISRKFLVFVAASVGAYFGLVSIEIWSTVAVAYIGSQAAVDAISAFIGGKAKPTVTEAATVSDSQDKAADGPAFSG